MTIYAVCNDMTLDHLTADELAEFEATRASHTEQPGNYRGNRVTYIRNSHGELVYMEASDTTPVDLNSPL